MNNVSRHRITFGVLGLDRLEKKAEHLKEVLEAMKGVSSASVNKTTEVVYIIYNDNLVRLEEIYSAIRDEGLEVEFIQHLQSTYKV